MPLAQLGRAWSNLEAAARANRLQPGLPSQHSASAFLAEDFLTQRTGRPDLYLSLRPVSSSAATITLAQTCVFLAAARALGAVSRSRRLRPGYFSLHPPLGHVTDLPPHPRAPAHPAHPEAQRATAVGELSLFASTLALFLAE